MVTPSRYRSPPVDVHRGHEKCDSHEKKLGSQVISDKIEGTADIEETGMPEGQLIEFSHVTKRYGDVTAVADLSARIEPGTVTGFLGPNGAGKTTSLRILLGQVRATSGQATIGGREFSELRQPLRTVGWVMEDTDYRPRRTAIRQLMLTARANGIPQSRVEEVLPLVGLEHDAEARIGTYSLGMRQRLSVATALLGDPGALVFDEPANGLDPEGIRWIRLLLRRLADEGRTVLVSSHLINEIERIADHVLVLSHGELLFDGGIDALADPSDGPVVVDADDRARLARALADAGLDYDLLRSGLTVRGSDPATVGAAAAAAGVALTSLQRRTASLEDVYFERIRTGFAGLTPQPSYDTDNDLDDVDYERPVEPDEAADRATDVIDDVAVEISPLPAGGLPTTEGFRVAAVAEPAQPFTPAPFVPQSAQTNTAETPTVLPASGGAPATPPSGIGAAPVSDERFAPRAVTPEAPLAPRPEATFPTPTPAWTDNAPDAPTAAAPLVPPTFAPPEPVAPATTPVTPDVSPVAPREEVPPVNAPAPAWPVAESATPEQVADDAPVRDYSAMTDERPPVVHDPLAHGVALDSPITPTNIASAETTEVFISEVAAVTGAEVIEDDNHDDVTDDVAAAPWAPVTHTGAIPVVTAPTAAQTPQPERPVSEPLDTPRAAAFTPPPVVEPAPRAAHPAPDAAHSNAAEAERAEARHPERGEEPPASPTTRAEVSNRLFNTDAVAQAATPPTAPFDALLDESATADADIAPEASTEPARPVSAASGADVPVPAAPVPDTASPAAPPAAPTQQSPANETEPVAPHAPATDSELSRAASVSASIAAAARAYFSDETEEESPFSRALSPRDEEPHEPETNTPAPSDDAADTDGQPDEPRQWAVATTGVVDIVPTDEAAAPEAAAPETASAAAPHDSGEANTPVDPSDDDVFDESPTAPTPVSAASASTPAPERQTPPAPRRNAFGLPVEDEQDD